MRKADEWVSFYGNNLRSSDGWSNSSILAGVTMGAHRRSCHFWPLGPDRAQLLWVVSPTPSLLFIAFYIFRGVFEYRYLFGGFLFSLGGHMYAYLLSPSLIIDVAIVMAIWEEIWLWLAEWIEMMYRCGDSGIHMWWIWVHVWWALCNAPKLNMFHCLYFPY